MMQFLSDFDDRCKEVEEYLRFVRFYDDIASNKKEKLTAKNYNGNKIEFIPSRQSQQILRSNFYVIIYNLIEATVNSVISAVVDCINDDKVPLRDLKPQIRKLYVTYLISNKMEKGTINHVLEIIQHIEKGTYVRIDNLGFNVSGNVEYNIVEKIVKSLGCSRKNVNSSNSIIDALSNTKRYRNSLAHGNQSFSTLGASIVLCDIEREFKEIKIYLQQILLNVKMFLENKKYLTMKKRS